jgi:hypothetical protein
LIRIANDTPQLRQTTITKRRDHYWMQDGHAETVKIKYAGLELQSAAVDATDPSAALRLVGVAGIETRDNESYPARLQQ